MSEYLDKFAQYLGERIIELEKLTIKDSEIPTGSEIKEADLEPDIDDGDSLEVEAVRVIGYKPKSVTKIHAKVVEDRRTGKDKGSVYVWNPVKKCIVKRKL